MTYGEIFVIIIVKIKYATRNVQAFGGKMAQNNRKHSDGLKPAAKHVEHVAPKKKPKRKATHVDSSAKKKFVKEYRSKADFGDIPRWVFNSLNVSDGEELSRIFEQEYRDAVRQNRAPFLGNVFGTFWYDDKMNIADIKESLRVRWLAQNSTPYGKLWDIVHGEMTRRYGPHVADRMGMPNGKRFKEDLSAVPHEDDELFLHTDQFKNAFEKAVKIPLSNWRVMNHCGNKVERMEFMCRIFIDGRAETMLGCFERRIRKNQFVRHGGSSIGMYGYFRGDNTKRFTVRRQDYKPPYSHRNKLVDGKVKFMQHGSKNESFALDLSEVKNTQYSHEHNFTISQRLFTNVRFSVDVEPTDKSRQLGREYVYDSFDEMSAEFMKNKNLLMFNIPLFEVQNETVVYLSEKYCPMFDAAYGSNFDIPKVLKRELPQVQSALIKVGKPPHDATPHLEKLFNLTADGGDKKHVKDNKTRIIRDIVDGKKSKRNDMTMYVQQQGEMYECESVTIQNLRNTEKRHKKKKPNCINTSHEFDDVSEQAKEAIGGMREFRKQKRKHRRGENVVINEEHYKKLAQELGFDEREYYDIEEGETSNATLEADEETLTESVYDNLDDEVENEGDSYER